MSCRNNESQFDAINVLERDFMMRHDIQANNGRDFNWTVKTLKIHSRFVGSEE